VSIPQVSIVGRPNVGKSSIFNWLAGRRLAIVDDMAGVTRDRMKYLLAEHNRYFEIVDTGGIGISDVDNLNEEIEQQIELGIQGASVLLLVVDARQGKTALDDTIAQRLRQVDKPIVLVANKCDGDNWEIDASDFFTLGLGNPVVCSAKNNRRKQILLDAIVAMLPAEIDIDPRETEPPEMKIAIVGRRNVGKSTLVNAICGSNRMIVSPIAGTTRDSVDVRIDVDGKTLVVIDTAGIRRGKSVRTDIEFYAMHRAHRSIRHADVVLMMFDASQRISNVDRQLCHYIASNDKPCMLVVNKWDLMAGELPTSRWADYLRENFANLWNAPIAFITAATGKNVKRMLNHAQMLFKQSRQRISTADLNKLMRRAIDRHPPPLIHKRRLKIYYATQIGIQPPTIVLKCNDPELFPKTYQRYLLSVLRDTLSFGEIPIRMIVEARSPTDSRDHLERTDSDKNDVSR
jgi:GTP-binding protein